MPTPAAPVTGKPPTSEIGYVTDVPTWRQLGGYASDDGEETAAVVWPESVRTFGRMRVNGTVATVLSSVTHPIRRPNVFALDPQDADPQRVGKLAQDLDLPILGQDRTLPPRRRGRFSWNEHVRLALNMLVYGHQGFEIVCDADALKTTGEARLRKLAPRFPGSIADMKVSRDGGLESVTQHRVGSEPARPIPIDNLLWYANERQGAAWQGQALPLDTPICTPDGWSTMGDLDVDSRVFDELGKVRHVVARSEVWPGRPCFRVTLSDGSSLVADENHLWESWTWGARHRGELPKVLTTAEMAATLHHGGETVRRLRFEHAIVKTAPLQYQRQHQLIDPYVLGQWLGDGATLHACIYTHADDAADTAAAIEGAGYGTKIVHNGAAGGNGRKINVTGGLRRLLSAHDLIGDKHIPDAYLRGDEAQRRALLAGLMDSDGSSSNGRCEFVNTNRNLADGVAELARSLGCHASIQTRLPNYGHVMPSGKPAKLLRTAYRVHFSPPFCPFRLPRKVANFESGDRRQRGATQGRVLGPRRWRTVVAVEPVEPRDTVCIEVDSPSHLFLAGEALIATHNSMLRPCYGDWLVLDRLLRVRAMLMERQGMGIPTGEAPAGAGQDVIDLMGSLASQARAGDQSGIGMPNGARIRLVGVEGTLPDINAAIADHKAALADAVGASFLRLGTGESAGNRALGQTFVDQFTQAQDSRSGHIADTATQHCVEKLWDWNYGTSDPAPAIVARPMDAETDLSVEELVRLVEAGVITGDDSIEDLARAKYRQPKRSTPTPGAPPAMTAEELAIRVDAAGALVRSGFDPDAALQAVGLDPIDHLGLLPITLQSQEAAEALPVPAGVAASAIIAARRARSVAAGRRRANRHPAAAAATTATWATRVAEALSAAVDAEAIATAALEGTGTDSEAVAAGLDPTDTAALAALLVELWGEGYGAGAEKAAGVAASRSTKRGTPVMASLSSMVARAGETAAGILSSLFDRLTGGLAADDAPDTAEGLRDMLAGLGSDSAAASRIAVTETHRAMVSGAVDTWAGMGITETQWVHIGSDEPCANCADLDGTTSSDGWDELPPLHPECHCEIEPA